MRFLLSLFLFVIIVHFFLGSAIAIDLQKRLPRASLSIGASQLDVAIAMDEAAREKGLMHEKSLGKNEGMLFIFPHPQRVAFWMKDTLLPLSIAYLNASGRILEIHDLKPFDEHSLLSNSSAVTYVIETPRDWFTEHQILSGDMVTGLPSFSSAK